MNPADAELKSIPTETVRADMMSCLGYGREHDQKINTISPVIYPVHVGKFYSRCNALVWYTSTIYP